MGTQTLFLLVLFVHRALFQITFLFWFQLTEDGVVNSAPIGGEQEPVVWQNLVQDQNIISFGREGSIVADGGATTAPEMGSKKNRKERAIEIRNIRDPVTHGVTAAPRE